MCFDTNIFEARWYYISCGFFSHSDLETGYWEPKHRSLRNIFKQYIKLIFYSMGRHCLQTYGEMCFSRHNNYALTKRVAKHVLSSVVSWREWQWKQQCSASNANATWCCDFYKTQTQFTLVSVPPPNQNCMVQSIQTDRAGLDSPVCVLAPDTSAQLQSARLTAAP